MEETKQQIIMMLLVHDEVNLDDMFAFFKNTDKMKHIGQTVWFLEEDGIATIRFDILGRVLIKLVDIDN